MHNESHHNSKNVLAIILIVLGGMWLLQELGVYINFPSFHFNELFFPFHSIFHNFWRLAFSWPVILIIVGLILMAGKRSRGGIILIILGGFFLLPRIFMLSGITAAVIFPVALIAVGIALIVRAI